MAIEDEPLNVLLRELPAVHADDVRSHVKDDIAIAHHFLHGGLGSQLQLVHLLRRHTAGLLDRESAAFLVAGHAACIAQHVFADQPVAGLLAELRALLDTLEDALPA